MIMKILFNKYISKDKLFLVFGSFFVFAAVLGFIFYNIYNFPPTKLQQFPHSSKYSGTFLHKSYHFTSPPHQTTPLYIVLTQMWE